jgi:hypothetical protein
MAVTKTDIIDPENVFFDGNHNIETIFDPESKETFQTDKDEEDKEDPDKDKAAEPAGNEGGEPAETNKEEYLNRAHYVLKMTGYDQEEIELDEGVVKKIADLDDSEQVAVLVKEIENMATYYEGVLAEENKKVAEFQNEDEKQIIEFLRNGGDKIKLAKHILSNDPTEKVSVMSDEEIVKAELKKEFPDLSDDDLDEEVADLKERKRLEKKAGIYRDRYQKANPEINSLLAEQQTKAKADAEANRARYEKEAAELREVAKKTTNIAGIPVSEDIINRSLTKLIPPNPDEDSEFIRGLTPDKILKYQFFEDNFDKIIQDTAKHWFKKGQEPLKKELRKFSNEPFGNTGSVKAKPKSGKVNIDDVIAQGNNEF